MGMPVLPQHDPGGDGRMRTHIGVVCHRCGHEWAYMRSKIAAIDRGQEHLRTKCGKCGAITRILK
jgi:RNase P subunit RPR2